MINFVAARRRTRRATGPFPAPALSRTRGSLVTLQTWGRACAVIILCTSNTAARQNISSHDHGQKVNFALRLILAPYVRTTSGYNRDHLEIATWVSVLLFPFYRGGAKRLKKHEAPGPIEEAIARITRGTNKRCFYLTARMREGEGPQARR